MSKPEKTPTGSAFLIVNGADIYPLVRDVTNIGRMDDNDIVLPSSHVSRYHAQIRRAGDSHIVVDLNSTSGTSVNGTPTGERLLVPGDVISLAGVPVIYGQTAGPNKLGAEAVTDPDRAAPGRDLGGETDAVDIGEVDRLLDLFDPPTE